MSGRFTRALRGEGTGAPPIWFMRQAGRYHAAYQALRRRHGFETLCREPDLAAEVALGPIRDFGFDAAILFSDLLFPLQALGMALSYDDGPPRLDGPLTADRLGTFRSTVEAAERLRFQADALAATRAALAPETGLIGFTGGPWTLFVYAVEGSHSGALARAKSSPALYARFAERMVPLLEAAIRMQLEAGADVVMLFDTAAGELSPEWFHSRAVPDLARLAHAFPGRLGYYAKGLQPAHLAGGALAAAPWAGLGYDWRWNLAGVLAGRLEAGRNGFVQGNFDPGLLFLTGRELEREVGEYLEPFEDLEPAARRAWICGLGHGVLPGTPEASVRAFIDLVRQRLS